MDLIDRARLAKWAVAPKGQIRAIDPSATLTAADSPAQSWRSGSLLPIVSQGVV